MDTSLSRFPLRRVACRPGARHGVEHRPEGELEREDARAQKPDPLRLRRAGDESGCDLHDVELEDDARASAHDEPEADDRLEQEQRNARDDVRDVEELVDRVRCEEDEDEQDDVDPQAARERRVLGLEHVGGMPDQGRRGCDADCSREDRRPLAAVDAEAVVVPKPAAGQREAEDHARPEDELREHEVPLRPVHEQGDVTECPVFEIATCSLRASVASRVR